MSIWIFGMHFAIGWISVVFILSLFPKHWSLMKLTIVMLLIGIPFSLLMGRLANYLYRKCEVFLSAYF